MKIQHLCKSFDGRVVLDHVSLTLESGGTACLMAPSGRGKTTLLRCIAGLETPDSGQITDLPERIAYVFQEDRLCDGFSAVDNIRLVTGKALGEGEIRRHLEELGLAGSLDQPVRELSGGMRRRGRPRVHRRATRPGSSCSRASHTIRGILASACNRRAGRRRTGRLCPSPRYGA